MTEKKHKIVMSTLKSILMPALKTEILSEIRIVKTMFV